MVKRFLLVLASFGLLVSGLMSTGASASSRWVGCASERGICYVPFPTTVRYGAYGAYVTARVNNAIRCTNSSFGVDPIYGARKSCAFSAASGPRRVPAYGVGYQTYATDYVVVGGGHRHHWRPRPHYSRPQPTVAVRYYGGGPRYPRPHGGPHYRRGGQPHVNIYHRLNPHRASFHSAPHRGGGHFGGHRGGGRHHR
jgi:hypothetical protein